MEKIARPASFNLSDAKKHQEQYLKSFNEQQKNKEIENEKLNNMRKDLGLVESSSEDSEEEGEAEKKIEIDSNKMNEMRIEIDNLKKSYNEILSNLSTNGSRERELLKEVELHKSNVKTTTMLLQNAMKKQVESVNVCVKDMMEVLIEWAGKLKAGGIEYDEEVLTEFDENIKKLSLKVETNENEKNQDVKHNDSLKQQINDSLMLENLNLKIGVSSFEKCLNIFVFQDALDNMIKKDKYLDLSKRKKKLEISLKETKSKLNDYIKKEEELRKQMSIPPPPLQSVSLPSSTSDAIDSLKRENAELLLLVEEAQKELDRLSSLENCNGTVDSNEMKLLQQENEKLLQLVDDLHKKLKGMAPSKMENKIKRLTKENKELLSLLEESMQEKESGGDVSKLHEENNELLAMMEEESAENEKLRCEITVLKESANKKSSSLINPSIKKRVISASKSLKFSFNSLNNEMASQLDDFLTFYDEISQQILRKIKNHTGDVDDIVAKYTKEKQERKRLFNLVQELRGNIRVFCRVRPASKSEIDEGHSDVHKVFDESEISLLNDSKGRTQQWEFDKVFSPDKNNETVFADVSDLVMSMLDGYNVCIFAYGQTGSGKTFTMEGTTSDRGINYRALDMLFRLSEARSGEIVDVFSMSILEVYNETLRDLLSTDVNKKIEIRGTGSSTHIPDAETKTVTCLSDVLNVCKKGYENRKTFSTNMNEHSSRSHCLLALYVNSVNKISKVESNGKLYLIDLAGSERLTKTGATGDRLEEAKNINKSLSALGDVIFARANKQAHIPFRNSVLTHLLTSSLSGDAKTLMFVNISPVSYNVEESACSLNFASRVRKVELGMAEKNKSPKKA